MESDSREMRRLIVSLNSNAKSLSIEFRTGTTKIAESCGPCVLLERDEAGSPLRLVISSLQERWLTNAFITPSIECTLDGCKEMEGPHGTKLYELGIGGKERIGSFYLDPAGNRTIVEDEANIAKERKEEAEEWIKELRSFIAESFESNPDLKSKYFRILKRFE